MSVIGSLELNVILEQVKKQCSFSLGIEYVDPIKPSFVPLVIRREHAYMRRHLQCVFMKIDCQWLKLRI